MKRQRSLPICLVLAASLAASAASAQPVVSSSPFQNAASAGQAPITLAQNGNVEVYLMVEQLKQEVRELRGMVEQQAYSIEQLKSQQKERYVDLDRRLADLEKRGGPAATLTPPPIPAPGPGAAPLPIPAPVPSAPAPAGQPQSATNPDTAMASEEIAASQAPVSDAQRKAYEQAYDLIRQRQFDKAVDALHAFINQYPSSDLTVNAYYWLGEVYLVMPKLEQAKQAFTVVVSRFPNHRKASDAYYKLGVTHDRMGDAVKAKEYLANTARKYPNSAAASLAQDYLKKMP